MMIKPITEYRVKRKYSMDKRNATAAAKEAYVGACVYVWKSPCSQTPARGRLGHRHVNETRQFKHVGIVMLSTQ